MAGDEQIDLGAEVERVQGELLLFRDVILPAFYRPGGLDPRRTASGGVGLLAEITHAMIDWQMAVTRLIEALPSGPGRGEVPAPDRDSFRQFMFQEASASYSARKGRIIWRIMLFADWDVAAATGPAWSGDQTKGDPLGAILGDPQGFGQSLLALAVDRPPLWDALCFLSPIVADADPGLAIRLLNPGTYRERVRADRTITPGVRRARLKFIDGYFRKILNNALLHGLGGLANNHFERIPALLGHPDLLGGYTVLMPHYLFAALFAKVSILHGLARESSEFGSP